MYYVKIYNKHDDIILVDRGELSKMSEVFSQCVKATKEFEKIELSHETGHTIKEVYK